MFCGHTAVFQRRLLAWQYPDLATSSAPGSWSSRSCSTARFLVFEPPSDLHGVGSMLEVIAAAFRQALCLGRIFVLQPLTTLQNLTYLKWRPAGCRGNALQCYFLPLSGCKPSRSEILHAVERNHSSSDGMNFDRFPLRGEKVLLLKGLPLGGPCSLCHDKWPLDSPFFDGLFLAGISESIPERGALKEAGAAGFYYVAFTVGLRGITPMIRTSYATSLSAGSNQTSVDLAVPAFPSPSASVAERGHSPVRRSRYGELLRDCGRGERDGKGHKGRVGSFRAGLDGLPASLPLAARAVRHEGARGGSAAAQSVHGDGAGKAAAPQRRVRVH